MTDREILELLLEKVSNINEKISSIENDVTNIKRQVRELKTMDNMILDEVERVHDILDKHTNNKTIHTA